MEITYDTGAKVILQGPVTYEVESATGGYLSVGKLTARVESEKRKRQCPNLQISSYPRSISLVLVRTPTATVTDLGTEFGVEVSKKGYTTSHVFRGSVKSQLLPRRNIPGIAPSCTRTSRPAWRSARSAIAWSLLHIVRQPADFVREIPNEP